MSSKSFPFAVRLIGFSQQECEAFEANFAVGSGKGYGYFSLAEENLQDPDLYIANGDDLKALVKLDSLRPSNIRPAMLVGAPMLDLPYPCVRKPVRWPALFAVLDDLVERRADALSRLEASDVITVPERRRRDRIDLDLTDPAEYARMRALVPKNGAVLVVDKNPVARDHVAGLLNRKNVPVAWASDEAQALESCRQNPTSIVIVNTSIPALDPYRLCWTIKERSMPLRTSVVLLVSKPADYDGEHARRVGADGYLVKPLASQHLNSMLKKFLPFL